MDTTDHNNWSQSAMVELVFLMFSSQHSSSPLRLSLSFFLLLLVVLRRWHPTVSTLSYLLLRAEAYTAYGVDAGRR